MSKEVTYTDTATGDVVVVAPAPSTAGVDFADTTIPDSAADDLAKVRSAQSLRSSGYNVMVPHLTDAEAATAEAAILADKANWSADEIAANVPVAADIETRRDEIRGYTDEEHAAHIEDNTTYLLNPDGTFDLDGNNVKQIDPDADAPPTSQGATDALITHDAAGDVVTVPDDATITTTLQTENEDATAHHKCAALVADGMLVTDLSISDLDDWNALFVVTDV